MIKAYLFILVLNFREVTEDAHFCVLRLRSILKQLEEKNVDFEEIKKNLDFTASLLEAVYLDGTR